MRIIDTKSVRLARQAPGVNSRIQTAMSKSLLVSIFYVMLRSRVESRLLSCENQKCKFAPACGRGTKFHAQHGSWMPKSRHRIFHTSLQNVGLGCGCGVPFWRAFFPFSPSRDQVANHCSCTLDQKVLLFVRPDALAQSSRNLLK